MTQQLRDQQALELLKDMDDKRQLQKVEWIERYRKHIIYKEQNQCNALILFV